MTASLGAWGSARSRKRRGLNVVTYSQMEHGMIEPNLPLTNDSV